MSNREYNLQFEKLCKRLKLGDINKVTEISGGLLHRMYAVETTKGKYAIKALNPNVMARDTAMNNFINSEKVAEIASNNIQALPAIRFNGESIVEVDKQYYLIFPWIRGNTLKQNEINIEHCKRIGIILADIHRIDFSYIGLSKKSSQNIELINWDYYLLKAQENNSELSKLFESSVHKLNEWDKHAKKSLSMISENQVISHRDLDSKNVMWNKDEPIVIDWEASGYINSMQELVETAIYWSQTEGGKVHKERFLTFINAYKERVIQFNKSELYRFAIKDNGNQTIREDYGYEVDKVNWNTVLWSNLTGKLGWLEYNLKRALRIECSDDEEQCMAIEEVKGTLKALDTQIEIMYNLENWINNNV